MSGGGPSGEIIYPAEITLSLSKMLGDLVDPQGSTSGYIHDWALNKNPFHPAVGYDPTLYLDQMAEALALWQSIGPKEHYYDVLKDELLDSGVNPPSPLNDMHDNLAAALVELAAMFSVFQTIYDEPGEAPTISDLEMTGVTEYIPSDAAITAINEYEPSVDPSPLESYEVQETRTTINEYDPSYTEEQLAEYTPSYSPTSISEDTAASDILAAPVEYVPSATLIDPVEPTFDLSELEEEAESMGTEIDRQIETIVLPRFQAGMRDINAVQSSSFVIGEALIEDGRNEIVAKVLRDLYNQYNIDLAAARRQYAELRFKKVDQALALERIKVEARDSYNRAIAAIAGVEVSLANVNAILHNGYISAIVQQDGFRVQIEDAKVRGRTGYNTNLVQQDGNEIQLEGVKAQSRSGYNTNIVQQDNNSNMLERVRGEYIIGKNNNIISQDRMLTDLEQAKVNSRIGYNNAIVQQDHFQVELEIGKAQSRNQFIQAIVQHDIGAVTLEVEKARAKNVWFQSVSAYNAEITRFFTLLFENSKSLSALTDKAFFTPTDLALRYATLGLDNLKSKIASTVDANRISLVARKEEHDKTMEYKHAEAWWLFEPYQAGANMLAGPGGGTMVSNSRGGGGAASAIGGALSGAAGGAQLGTMIGGPGPGTAIGAAVGGIAGLFSGIF